MHIIQTISKIFASFQIQRLSSLAVGTKQPKQQLGRWTVEYCDRMTRKIDWANHDHCGPCNIQQNTSNVSTKCT